MKRTIQMLGISLVFILFSCKKDQDVSPSIEKLADNSSISETSLSEPSDTIQFIANYMEVEPSDIVAIDSTYIIQGDMVMTSGQVNDLMLQLQENPPMARQRFYLRRLPVNPYFIKNVKVRLWCTNPDWYNACVEAINNWNTAAAANSSTVRFSIVTSGEKILINDGFNKNESWIGRARLPYSWYNFDMNSDGPVSPGPTVEINQYYNYLSMSEKVNAITHELGHTIGFKHTDQTEGEHIPGTPTSDPMSVMHSINHYWTGFTTGDIQAIKAIYPN